jgi:hypothetical protein
MNNFVLQDLISIEKVYIYLKIHYFKKAPPLWKFASL